MSGVDAGQAGTGGQGQDDKTKTDAGATGGTQDKADAGQTGGKGDVQTAINEIVRRERTDADRRVAELQRQLDELKSQAPAKKATDDVDAFRAKVEEARKPLETELESERTKRQALNTRLIRSELKTAAAESVDPEHVADLLAKHLRVTDAGDFEVVDQDGKPSYGARGAKSVSELVSELLAAKPYLAKSTARNGADFNGSRTHAPGDIDSQIAEAEKTGNWATAQRLKTQKLKAAPAA